MTTDSKVFLQEEKLDNESWRRAKEFGYEPIVYMPARFSKGEIVFSSEFGYCLFERYTEYTNNDAIVSICDDQDGNLISHEVEAVTLYDSKEQYDFELLKIEKELY